MPKTLMFARLIDDEDLSDESKGRYLRNPAHELKRLFDKIDVPDLGTESASIPDMWAQPLRFQQALLNGDAAARAEWRGLLAFYVLRGELGAEGRLLLQPVFGPASEPEPTSFLSVARTFLPDKLTEVHVGWESIHLLLFDRSVIGCTSPLTFLSPPATRAKDITIPNCTWFAKGVFSDPIPSLVGARLVALREWLAEAQTALASTPPERYRTGEASVSQRHQMLDAVEAEKLRREIALFVQEIDIADRAKSHGIRPRIEILPQGTHLFTGIVQSFLGYKPRIRPVDGEDQLRLSSFLLQPARGAGVVQPVLLISQNFCNLDWCKKGGIEVYGGMNLNDALVAYKPQDHGVLGQAQLAPGRVYKAEEIFTERIYQATNPKGKPGEKTSGFPGAYDLAGFDKMLVPGGGGTTPLLPLRSDFAAHFTSEYLRDNVTFSGDSTQITVTLNIRLNADGASLGAPIPISRVYKRESIVEGLIPEVSIWPEYDGNALPGWKTWFTFYDDWQMPGDRLRVSPVSPAGTAKGTISTVITDTTDRTKVITVHEGNAFPEKLFCSIGGQEAGILLPKGTERREVPNVELWKIGVDFGTTGSSIFYCKGPRSRLSRPVVLPLEPHLLAVSKPGMTETNRFFLPVVVENVAGVLSVFRDFHPILPNVEIVPLRDGNICFQEFDEDETGICANMKWGNAAERARAKSFLKQLCLLTALQAKIGGAQEIEWVFSYPLSFSGDRADEFELTWSESRDFAFAASGYQLPDNSSPPQHFNESICAALYARDKMGAGLGAGALILDIGGGSSDISIWASEGAVQNTSLLNASVKFGGRDIFQRPLIRGSNTLPHMLGVGDGGLSDMEEISGMSDDTLAFSKLDFLFKGRSEDASVMPKIMSKLDNARKEPDAVAFSKLLGLALQGLFYYSGLLLRQKQQEAPEGTQLLGGVLPDVYVCGNGSKIFPWLGLGSFSSTVEDKLLSAFAAGAGGAFRRKPTARIIPSKDPKTEAAYGMLVALGNEKFEPQRIISGEVFRYRDKEFKPTDVVPYETLDGAVFTVPSELPGLRQALREMGLPDLSAETAEWVHKGLDKRFKKIAQGRKSTIGAAHDEREEEQPIFIMELLELIECATSDWKQGKAPWW